jgi:hypothetical protein
VPPSGGATIIADADSTTTAFAPSTPIPVPGGTEPTWTVSSNGILTAGTPGNQTTSGTASLTSTTSATRLAFYTWCNHNPVESGSGKIKREEVSGVLYVTFDGVEFSGGSPTAAPSTFQWQINMATGDVVMLWPSFSASDSTGDVLVGCTLALAGLTPVTQTLSAATPYTLAPDTTPLSPMVLTATPRPVINPATLVTYTLTNVPEFMPGFHVGTVFFTVNPLPGGVDLSGILTTVPGCRVYLATLDADIGAASSATTTLSWNLNFSNVYFAPGNVIAAQAVALFDPAMPLSNGENGGFLLSNAVLSVTHLQ